MFVCLKTWNNDKGKAEPLVDTKYCECVGVDGWMWYRAFERYVTAARTATLTSYRVFESVELHQSVYPPLQASS